MFRYVVLRDTSPTIPPVDEYWEFGEGWNGSPMNEAYVILDVVLTSHQPSRWIVISSCPYPMLKSSLLSPQSGTSTAPLRSDPEF
jgi:hypothetical protein